MLTRAYLGITTLLFFAATMIHMLRLLNHWPAQIGDVSIPVWSSWVGLVIAGILCLWGLCLAVFKRHDRPHKV